MDEKKDGIVTEVGIVEDENSFSLGFIPSLPDAIVLHFFSDPPQALAFVGQAREKFFAQVMQAGFLLGMTVEPEEEELQVELKKKPTLH